MNETPLAVEPKKNARKILFFFAKTAVAVALIYWLVRQNRLDFSQLERLEFDAPTLSLLMAAALSVFVSVFVLAWRLKILLDYQGIRITFGRSTALTFVGAFFGTVLPGLVGGDVIKAMYICTDAPDRRPEAVAAVMVDRLIGLYALLLLGTLALGAGLATGMLPVETPILAAAPVAVGLGTLAMLLLAWPRLRRSRPVQWLFSLAPHKGQDLMKALTRFVKSPRVMAQVVGLSLVNHILVVLSFVTTAWALGDRLPVLAHFILNPLAMAMNAIALTPGGIGLAEGAFSILFEAAGSSNGAMIGLLGRLIAYAVFMLGGVAALLVTKTGRKAE